MYYEFEHVKDITRVILFVLCLCLLSSSSVFVMKLLNLGDTNVLNSSCCGRVPCKIPLISLSKYLNNEEHALLEKVPADKFFVPEYYKDEAGCKTYNTGLPFIPIYDKNGNNILVKHEGKCYYLFVYDNEFYRSGIPSSSCTTWKSSLLISGNEDEEKYKFTDYAQLCSC